MLALEQVSVINDLKGGNAETREEQSRNNSAVLGQGPDFLKDIRNNSSLSPIGSCSVSPLHEYACILS